MVERDFEERYDALHSKLFENLSAVNQTVDEKLKVKSLSVIDSILSRIENLCVMFCGEYFNEEDAARFLRLPDPERSGKSTIETTPFARES